MDQCHAEQEGMDHEELATREREDVHGTFLQE